MNARPHSQPADQAVRRRFRWIAGAMIGVHTLVLAWNSCVHSPNANESAHMVAGISHLRLFRFELYRVNPPLIRTIAALPAVALGYEPDWDRYSDSTGSRAAFFIAPNFVDAIGEQSARLIIYGRLICIPFSWLGAWICSRWARELYGRRAGLLALAVWCFSPTILGQASFMTPDAGAAVLALTAVYCFHRWLTRPGIGTATVAGVLLGLALLSKLTLVVFFILWPAIWGVYFVTSRNRQAEHDDRPGSFQFSLILIVGVYVLNIGYGFDGAFRRLDQFEFVSHALGGPDASRAEPGNRFQDTILAPIPVPLPAQFVLGADIQKADFEGGRRTWFRGVWHERGLWYYYLYAMAVKIPVGTLLIGVMACVAFVRRPDLRSGEAMVMLHFAAFLGVVSAETSWNAHLRYALPCIPFAFVLISRAALAATNQTRAVVVGALTWTATSSLFCVPHSVAYFNEPAGGPLSGHFHLIDSNVDWGQDLFYLRNWLDQHPDIGPVGLACYGQYNPKAVGIEFFLPEDDSSAERQPGYYAVSATMLRGMEFWQTRPDGSQFWCKPDAFVDFMARTPIDRVGYSILIYRVEQASDAGVR